MNIKPSLSSETYCIDGKELDINPTCKYLGISVDNKLTYLSHINTISKRLAKQCGVIAKLRHFAPRSKLLNYYKTNIQSILQYGILVYGCTSYSNLLPLFALQKKILKLFHFRKLSDSSSDIFLKHHILNVYQLHIYELVKFVLKSVNDLHLTNF